MSNMDNPFVNRRTILGSVAAVAAGLALPSPASAGNGSAHKPVDQDSVDYVASRLDHDLVALRRDIHLHPELSGEESRTAAIVAQQLQAAGLDVRTGVGGHGVVGVLTGVRPGRTVAYRADMDATTAGGGSTQATHLCGHDMHTTIGVGVAQVLARLRHRLSGRVVFVFQPAEETLTGAAAMLDAGVLAHTRPSEIHALHCGPFPVGQFGVTPGYGMPGLDRGAIAVTGPDAPARAKRLAAEVNALGTISPPTSSADMEKLVADMQIPDGPLAEFVFMRAQATDAEVRVSFRCWPEQRYTEIRESIRALASSSGNATVSFPNDPFPALVCPEREGSALKRHLRHALGRNRVRTLHAAPPFNGEDFALFVDRIPGTYTFLGVRAPGAAVETSFPHMGAFDPDERAIGYGVRAMAGWLAMRTRV